MAETLDHRKLQQKFIAFVCGDFILINLESLHHMYENAKAVNVQYLYLKEGSMIWIGYVCQTFSRKKTIVPTFK